MTPLRQKYLPYIHSSIRIYPDTGPSISAHKILIQFEPYTDRSTFLHVWNKYDKVCIQYQPKNVHFPVHMFSKPRPDPGPVAAGFILSCLNEFSYEDEVTYQDILDELVQNGLEDLPPIVHDLVRVVHEASDRMAEHRQRMLGNEMRESIQKWMSVGCTEEMILNTWNELQVKEVQDS